MKAGHFRFKNVSTGDLNRGRRTESRVLFGYFLHDAKSDNSFSLQRISRFCKPQISPPQPQLRTATIKTFLRELRGFANLESAHKNNNFPLTKLNPFAARLLETWSPCSRPFAILPVSAVSDAQKLATGNFLHVRAAFCAACGGSLSVAVATFLPPAAALFKGSHFPSKREKEQRRRDRNGKKISNRLCQKYRKGLVRKEIRQNVD